MDLPDSQHTDELATLLALRDQGSLAAAGRALQRHPSVLSKRLAALERRLGVRLVERTTRQLHFTDAGLRLVEKVQQAAGLIADAEQEAAQGASQVQGRLRIAMPAAMGRRWLSPMVAEFALAHPQVVLEVEYSDRLVDIVGERFDGAIRIGTLADSRLAATRLCGHQRILCASPAYLQRRGTPRVPADLARHDCLGFTGLLSYPEWHLMRPGEPRHTVLVHGPIVSNDSEALLTAALMGVGVLAGGDWLMKPHGAAGTLVHVLPGWRLDVDSGIHLVRPSARFSTAAMAAFREWVVAWFATREPWQGEHVEHVEHGEDA
ncbi:LysR substrate-binding domain-containing protein [Acidovorax sp. NCPPB 4044]|uniref:LysR substrate-binding domain-containing protein n=1 Tax=Acidovorax sp. NCPPB 4044 TaxID=2940490 RepID=UPI002303D201|nr:LysR substrate-binding domain-containing protein [Acidovorax sp. NCPPB 4044]MDA8521172.1 LysR substrate-binding domain-containing protein [Acidovorax sp. NCPPB 4044]